MEISNRRDHNPQTAQPYHVLITATAVIYIAGVSAYMLWHRVWFSPDQFFAFAILGALLLGRGKQFIGDWVPALLLLFGYEYLLGLGPILMKSPDIYILMKADELAFGRNITIFLQSALTATSLHS